MIYDVIGDIHGHATKLKGLLNKLGYTVHTDLKSGNPYYQPPKGHRAMFIGDLIDRGTEELETLQIVYAMIDAGVADCVMGNHEYNALAYATENKRSDSSHYLRAHNTTHTRQHQEFLNEVPFGSKRHKYWLKRFYELPLWIETEHACFVHACWHVDQMNVLKPLLTEANRLTEDALQRTGQKGSVEHEALERVLKGVEAPLPENVTFTDKDGTVRSKVRVNWWQDNLSGQRIIDIARAMPADLEQIPQGAMIDHVDFKLQTTKPVFVGHYWMQGTPEPLSPQVVCTDYSAAGSGYLTAYLFDTTNPMPLSKDNFVQYIPD